MSPYRAPQCAFHDCTRKPYPGLSKCGEHMQSSNVSGVPTAQQVADRRAEQVARALGVPFSPSQGREQR